MKTYCNKIIKNIDIIYVEVLYRKILECKNKDNLKKTLDENLNIINDCINEIYEATFINFSLKHHSLFYKPSCKIIVGGLIKERINLVDKTN